MEIMNLVSWRFSFAYRAFLLFALILCGSLRAAELTFDGWADAFSAEWVSGDPILATVTQYFDGAEQDALDRRLTPITKEYRASRVALARRGLEELAKFKRD
jgi:hypothetical protein